MKTNDCWDCGRTVIPNAEGKVPKGIFGVTCWECMGSPSMKRQFSESLTDILNNGLRGGGSATEVRL